MFVRSDQNLAQVLREALGIKKQTMEGCLNTATPDCRIHTLVILSCDSIGHDFVKCAVLLYLLQTTIKNVVQLFCPICFFLIGEDAENSRLSGFGVVRKFIYRWFWEERTQLTVSYD